MDVTPLKTNRKALRTSFTVCTKKIEDFLKSESVDVNQLSVLKMQLNDKFARLEACQKEISNLLLTDEQLKSTYGEDFLTAENYRDTFCELCAKLDRLTVKNDKSEECAERRKFKLPTIELKKFSGDAKEYLSFWSQYKKIHEDVNIPNEDKFQYLLQAVVPNSKAARVVDSFPATAENYPKAISQLQERFGREELLVQIYVRDLLSMVMKNAAAGRTKTDLPKLYDELEAKIRALESLGRSQKKYGEFLSPLVESCLPEEILLAWERNRNMKDTQEAEDRSLEKLMNFLRQEVKGEEMMELARSGFSARSVQKKEYLNKSDNYPTAATLVSTYNRENTGKRISICVFCSKKNHASKNCFEAREMSLEEKKKRLVKNNACFSCFSVGHISRLCKVKNSCLYCSKNHHYLMCYSKNETSDKRKSEVTEANSLTNNCNVENVYLMTLILKVKTGGRFFSLRTLIDSGSQFSYISVNAIQTLGLESNHKIKMQHMLFGGRETRSQLHDVYDLTVTSSDESYSLDIRAFSQRKLCGTVPKISDPAIITELKQKGFVLSDVNSSESEISLLLGADVCGKLFTRESVRLDSGLFVAQTSLGNCLLGKREIAERGSNGDCTLNVTSLYAQNLAVKDFFSLEAIGISDPIESKRKDADHSRVLQEFKNNMKVLPSGRFELRLPFKAEVAEFNANRELAWNRHKKMCMAIKDKLIFDDYKEVFQEWEKLGVIERVNSNTEVGHFLPHRPVIKSDSTTTKIRPVFDASAKEGGKFSLNDLLYKGPNLIELIPDIIDRFRSFPIGLSADIEKAFLMLGIAPEHRDFLRFYFPSENEKIVYRHCRVVFGVSSSPFLLSASISHLLDNLPSEFQTVAQKLKRAFYVDNCVTGVSNVAEMEKLIATAKDVMAQGCFNLRNWESNINCDSVCKSSGVTKVLGILWNLDRDTLKCNVDVDNLIEEQIFTKRYILSTIQKIFDPIGLLSSATLPPKILLQHTWSLNLNWDASLPDSIVKSFKKWLNEVQELKEIEIPRYFEINNTTQMHVFVDACKDAYATCIFLRSDTAQGRRVYLVRAKSRVAPLKQVTIPRLELMACCIGARLAYSVQQALNITDMETIFWSDSMVALYWLREQGEWSIFVSNRVKEIKMLFPRSEWRHVPSKMNPADLISRGCSPGKLMESRWWEGPLWLLEPSDTWPVTELINSETSEIDSERKRLRICNLNLVDEKEPWYGRKFSKFHSIIRLVAWVLRFTKNARFGVNQREKGELTLKEIESAETHLIRSVQARCFPDEKSINLCTFKDENNIIRVKTRITERIDTPRFLSPILLPNNCVFTQRLVEHFHTENYHAGTQLLLSIIREKYWILGGRRTVRKIWNACVKCRRFKSKSPIADPVSLPADRVENAAVFEVVGVDLAGPLYIKRGNKVWIVLYSCALYRAIHLELVSSLSTEAFLLSFRRFIARRGRPRVIYSDNGTNFRGAFNEIAAIDWSKVSRYAEIQRISWKFIPPTAAWWGGFWERLVRTVKEILRRTLGKAIFTYEELVTILCECEKIVNSRPLTYLSEDMQDLTPITPIMFLLDKSTCDVTDLDFRDANHFRKRLKFRSKMIEELRKRFRNEYLGQLIQRQKVNPQSSNIQLGDVVLIGDDIKKRLQWPLARVIELIPGKDGLVRTVKLKTQSNTLIRPIQRVFPLEVNGSDFQALPLQEVKPTEAGPECLKPASLQEDQPQFSRCGRTIKKPTKLDL